jgi:hypothetical protein
MKDTPIIFSGPMARALLDGRKTMTRRLAWVLPGKAGRRAKASRDWPPGMWPSSWQNRQPGDRLWVRESLATHGNFGFPLGETPQVSDLQGRVWSYTADGLPHRTGGRPSIHMPRWASRLTLEITAVKLEPLKAISEQDALAEGVQHDPTGNPQIDRFRKNYFVNFGDAGECRGVSAKDAFGSLWETLHGECSWIDTGEVVALTFTVHKQNIDAMPKAAAA